MMFVDSPIEYCPREGCMVLLDQTRRECAEEHRCIGTAHDCPLRRHFSGRDFGVATGRLPEESQED